MSVKSEIQDAMKTAMKAKDAARLGVLRMAKGALLLKEKEGLGEVTDEIAIAAVRSEVKKRRQSIDTFRELGKEEEAKTSEWEIDVLEEFLPKQLTADQVEEKVKAYLAANPDVNHAGKLTGALKKELGDTVDGKLLNEVCRKALG